ncbi:MAG: hypothetical protein COA44_01445 [Arcobacter sp.]|nr:MAG: hypothetical protein COA44_01445 [Arcobacter sp.]
METGTQYQSYINASKNLHVFEGRSSYQAPYADKFEKIYERANEENIKVSNAKIFLEELSQVEINTLQKYTGLVDTINLSQISDEGAYNLLMHDYEQYDFNSDGVAEVGEGRMILPIPKTMPSGVRDAYITALNSLNGEERLMVTTLTFDINHLKSVLYDTPYVPSVIDYEYLSKNVEQALNPSQGGYSAPVFKEAVQKFWDVFQSVYEGSTEIKEKEESRSPEIEKFLKDLREKGASQFLADFNQEKIDAKVEEYRQKLLDELGISPEAMAQIDEMVNTYRKQLLEELEASLDKDDKEITISKQAMIQTLLNLKGNEKSELERLLQN